MAPDKGNSEFRWTDDEVELLHVAWPIKVNKNIKESTGKM